MDYVLDFLDDWFFDSVYAKLFPLSQSSVLSSPYLSNVSSLARDNVYRQLSSLFLITMTFGYLLYFIFSSLSYFLIFDHNLMKHPKFLTNQVQREMTLACTSIPWITLLTLPWFLAEVRGYSRLYDHVEDYGWIWMIGSCIWFIFITDFLIYCIHRAEHIPILYKHVHKPHHKWIIPTPFASHAFHPIDGYAQSIPYHLFVFIFPMHKIAYLGMFVFVNIWTIMIHDGEYLSHDPFINGAAHHTLHHLYFNYNYGQYFTLWDRIGGSHRAPTDEEFDKKKRFDFKTFQKQIQEVDEKESIQNAEVKSKTKGE